MRDAGIRGLLAVKSALPTDPGSTLHAQLVRRVWVARCDPLPENRELADQLWEELDLHTYTGLCSGVLEDVAHPVGKVGYI